MSRIIKSKNSGVIKKDRIDWVDMARGVGIFLVVLGHVAKLPNFIGLYIYTFHLPLFFLLSGYLFNPAKYTGFRAFITSRAQRLVFPYVLFSVLSFFFFLLLNWRSVIGSGLLSSQLYYFFGGLIFAVRGTAWTEHSGALWFLACLFFTEIFFYLIIHKIKGNHFSLLKILLIISVVAYLYSKLFNYPLPWSIDASLTATVFYGLGFLIKEKNIINFIKPSFGIVATLFLVNFWAGITNKPVDMFSGSYGNYFLFYIAAFAGTAMVITVVRLIKKCPTLSFLGQNSLAIMGLHFYIGITLADLIFKYCSLNNLFFAINYSSRIYILRDLFLLLLVSIGYASLVILIITPLIFLLKTNWRFSTKKVTDALSAGNIINK